MRPHRLILVLGLLVPALVVPALVALPVAAMPQARPHPVKPEIRTMKLSGIDDDARRALHDGSDEAAGRRLAGRSDLRVLTAARSTRHFELVGVTWAATGQQPALVVRVRTRAAAGGWSDWESLAVNDDERPDDVSGLRGATSRTG